MILHGGQAQLKFSGSLGSVSSFVCFGFPRHYSFLITALHRKFLVALHVPVMVVPVQRALKASSDFQEEHQWWLNNHSASLTWLFCHCKPEAIVYGSRCQYPQLHLALEKDVCTPVSTCCSNRTALQSTEIKRRDDAKRKGYVSIWSLCAGSSQAHTGSTSFWLSRELCL